MTNTAARLTALESAVADIAVSLKGIVARMDSAASVVQAPAPKATAPKLKIVAGGSASTSKVGEHVTYMHEGLTVTFPMTAALAASLTAYLADRKSGQYADTWGLVRSAMAEGEKPGKFHNKAANAYMRDYVKDHATPKEKTPKTDKPLTEKQVKRAARAERKARKLAKAQPATAPKIAASAPKRTAADGIVEKIVNAALACKSLNAAKQYIAKWSNGQPQALQDSMRTRALGCIDDMWTAAHPA